MSWAVVAAIFDWRYRRLPNWLTLGGFAVGAAYILITGAAPLGGDSLRNWLAAGVAFGVLFPAYLFHWMGAGDVKLFAAMGLLGGGKVLLPTFLVASLLVGGWALIRILFAGELAPFSPPCENTGGRRGDDDKKQEPVRAIPFGVGLSVGFVLSVLGMLPPLPLPW